MSRRYGMQVLVHGRWEDVRPTGEPPYRYRTRKEAEQMLRMAYPGEDVKGEARIVEVES